MAYVASIKGMARLRSAALLEKAMRVRDINGRELARTALTSAQTVSQLRTGARLRVRADTARRLEQALRVPRGSIFSVETNQHPGPNESPTSSRT
jgi:DNA-binding Xre family transcriptional regulator